MNNEPKNSILNVICFNDCGVADLVMAPDC